MSLEIKHLHPGHLDGVMDIEARSFDQPLDVMEMVGLLKGRSVMGWVIVGKGRLTEKDVCGFLICEKRKKCIEILNVAVDFDHRRREFGTQLLCVVKKAAKKWNGIRCIRARVADHNTDAHHFFSDNGFSAVGISKDFWNGVDAYDFRYELSCPVPKNRLNFGEPNNVADV